MPGWAVPAVRGGCAHCRITPPCEPFWEVAFHTFSPNEVFWEREGEGSKTCVPGKYQTLRCAHGPSSQGQAGGCRAPHGALLRAGNAAYTDILGANMPYFCKKK